MTFLVHTQKSLDKLTWNEIQKLHTTLGLKATAEARTRHDYQRRIVAAQPQPVVEPPEHVATPLTCATCPLARRLDNDDNRYCCGLTDAVTRGHWEANSDCYEAIAELETEMTEQLAEAEIPTPKIPVADTDIGSSEAQPEEAAIAPTKRAMPFFFNLPLPEYVDFSEKQSVPCCLESITRDRAKEYKNHLRLEQRDYEVYGGNQPPVIDFWQFHAYLQLINSSASYAEVVKNAGTLNAAECLEFIIASECPFIFHELEYGKQYFNYAPIAKYVWATTGCQTDIGTNVTVHDSINAIAERIRSCLDGYAKEVWLKTPTPIVKENTSTQLTVRPPYGWKFSKGYWIKEWEGTKFQKLPIEIIKQYGFTESEILFLESEFDSSLTEDNALFYEHYNAQAIREYIPIYS